MGFYRQKPVVVEAVQFLPEKLPEGLDGTKCFIGAGVEIIFRGDTFTIHTKDGEVRWHSTDWLVRGVKGGLSRCSAEIFAETYEGATEQ